MDNCEWRKEHQELKEFLEELQKYQDTGLTPEKIVELRNEMLRKSCNLRETDIMKVRWCMTNGSVRIAESVTN